LLVGVPVALIFFAMKKKIVSNYDLSDRRERPKVLGVLLALEIINLLILRSMVSAQALAPLLVILLTLIGFTIITFWWKISGHALAAALATGFIVSWYGWAWWPVLLIVPIVGWSRVIRKNHTTLQVIAGALYAWMFVYFFL
jgi:membrane-associated phospholipid phosphatase